MSNSKIFQLFVMVIMGFILKLILLGLAVRWFWMRLKAMVLRELGWVSPPKARTASKPHTQEKNIIDLCPKCGELQSSRHRCL